MTWDEFKEAVDALLALLGEDGSVNVWYIDVTYPTGARLDVGVASGHGLTVDAH